MKPYDKAFYEQLDYIVQQYREGHIKTIPELMRFIEMAYGDYREFHPNELPEIRYAKPTNEPDSVPEESGSE
jgi:hypothetical protein